MNHPAYRKTACVLAAALALPGLTLAAPETAPSLPAIIQQAIARDAATQQALRGMQYRQTSHTEQLNGRNEVTHHHDEILIVRPGAPSEFQVVSARGDTIPSDPDQAAQKAKGQEMERRQHDFSLKTLVGHFAIRLLGPDNWNGESAYVLAFQPKPNQPYRDQTEKVLNQLQGRIWIRTSDYAVLKTEAALAHPVQVAWIFASIKSLDFHYELHDPTGDFGPSWISTAVEVDAPFLVIRQRQRIDMTQFQPRNKLASAAKP